MVLETHRTECSKIAQKLKFGTQLFSGPKQPQLPSLVLLLLEVVSSCDSSSLHMANLLPLLIMDTAQAQASLKANVFVRTAVTQL